MQVEAYEDAEKLQNQNNTYGNVQVTPQQQTSNGGVMTTKTGYHLPMAENTTQ